MFGDADGEAQEDPLSCLLFVLHIEPLSCMLAALPQHGVDATPGLRLTRLLHADDLASSSPSPAGLTTFLSAPWR